MPDPKKITSPYRSKKFSFKSVESDRYRIGPHNTRWRAFKNLVRHGIQNSISMPAPKPSLIASLHSLPIWRPRTPPWRSRNYAVSAKQKSADKNNYTLATVKFYLSKCALSVVERVCAP
jgi:hypothetical protein